MAVQVVDRRTGWGIARQLPVAVKYDVSEFVGQCEPWLVVALPQEGQLGGRGPVESTCGTVNTKTGDRRDKTQDPGLCNLVMASIGSLQISSRSSGISVSRQDLFNAATSSVALS